MAVNYANIAGQEPSTVTFKVGTVTIARGSTNEQQEILVIGDPQTSNALARVVAAEPASTEFGLITRVAGRVLADQNSTVWATQSAQAGAWAVRANLSSTSADNPVSAVQSGGWTVSVSGYSTTVNVSSLGGKVAVVNSSAADLNVTVAGYSTTANVSSVAGIVAVRPSDTNWASSAGFHFDSSGALQVAGTFSASTTVNVSSLAGRVGIAGWHQSGSLVNVTDSTNNAINVNVVAGAAAGSTIVTVSTGSVRVHQSTAADLQATVTPASTVWAVQVAGYSTIVSVAALPSGLLSTAAPSSNSSGVIVRQVVDAIATVASTAACASTSFSIQSSGANLRSYVTAFTVLSTVAVATKFGFYTSNTLLWPLQLQAMTSGVTGANLAVAAPGYLFRTGASEALSFRTPSSVTGVRLGVSYFIAP